MATKNIASVHGHCLGGKRSITYIIWKRMVGRCHYEKDRAFAQYGGRGIRVCDAWRNSFSEFLKDMGPRPDGLQLDRIDNEAGYSKDNCRWVTRSAQARNRRDTIFVEFEGKRVALQDLSGISVLPMRAVRKRLAKGWNLMDALTTPSYRPPASLRP